MGLEGEQIGDGCLRVGAAATQPRLSPFECAERPSSDAARMPHRVPRGRRKPRFRTVINTIPVSRAAIAQSRTVLPRKL